MCKKELKIAQLGTLSLLIVPIKFAHFIPPKEFIKFAL